MATVRRECARALTRQLQSRSTFCNGARHAQVQRTVSDRRRYDEEAGMHACVLMLFVSRFVLRWVCSRFVCTDSQVRTS